MTDISKQEASDAAQAFADGVVTKPLLLHWGQCFTRCPCCHKLAKRTRCCWSDWCDDWFHEYYCLVCDAIWYVRQDGVTPTAPPPEAPSDFSFFC